MEGFRPFIGFNGCHLKGSFGGTLLPIVCLDANSGVFPLTMCICEGEINASWMWFLNHLKAFLNFPHGNPLCFITDRQKEVLTAMQKIFPYASNR